MAATMPSATTTRAKARLDQCVMCNPWAMGSRHSQFDDLSPLQGGKSAGDAPRAERPSAGLPVPPAHRDDSVARPWPHDTAAGGPPFAGVVQHQQPTSSGHVAPETKGGTGYEPCFGEAGHRQLRSSADEAFDHASGNLLCWDSGTLRPSIATCPEFLALLRAGDTRSQRWVDHFQWSEQRPFEIVEITAHGRVTVARLQMNYPDLVTIRRLLAALSLPWRAEV